MVKTKINKLSLFILVATLFLSGAGVTVVRAVSCSSSSDCNNQINNLSNDNAQSQQNLSNLQGVAASYQDQINMLQAQIDALQQQIAQNEAIAQNLDSQIAQKQAEIDKNKAVLGDNLHQMYIDGQMSTMEMLASSKNISDYVDRQEYQNSIQNKVQDILKTITALQQDLKSQKAQVDQILASKQAQNNQIAAAESQQAGLLAMNKQQQEAYNSKISSNNANIQKLRQQQAALIQSGTRSVPVPSGGSGGACDNGNGNGSYPMAWCNAAQDSIDTIPPYSSWDLNNRECTSYAYWYFTQVEGHYDFSASGDAKSWADTSNYATHSNPAVGAIAVETTGTYGHVAIVRALPGQTYAGNTVPSGYVLVSEMNYDWYGHFRFSYSPLSKFSDYIY